MLEMWENLFIYFICQESISEIIIWGWQMV